MELLLSGQVNRSLVISNTRPTRVKAPTLKWPCLHVEQHQLWLTAHHRLIMLVFLTAVDPARPPHLLADHRAWRAKCIPPPPWRTRLHQLPHPPHPGHCHSSLHHRRSLPTCRARPHNPRIFLPVHLRSHPVGPPMPSRSRVRTGLRWILKQRLVLSNQPGLPHQLQELEVQPCPKPRLRSRSRPSCLLSSVSSRRSRSGCGLRRRPRRRK